jgi:hypothetical protein
MMSPALDGTARLAPRQASGRPGGPARAGGAQSGRQCQPPPCGPAGESESESVPRSHHCWHGVRVSLRLTVSLRPGTDRTGPTDSPSHRVSRARGRESRGGSPAARAPAGPGVTSTEHGPLRLALCPEVLASTVTTDLAQTRTRHLDSCH